MQEFEKLGAFYLGRTYDLSAGTRQETLVLYDSRDLVTHGVCVGMTGSGKTGLCVSLLEEAAMDGIPVIAVDPKGDLGNLLLTFPSLAPEDFRPWINEDDARRKGMTADQFASDQADRWKRGLAEWGENGARISRLRGAADFAIYTPGSTAGLPLSILKSLDAPPAAILGDPELLGERVGTTATSLLTLAGLDVEPVRSREHILVSTILSHAWGDGRAIDLTGLIQAIQQPPAQRVGVLEVESFFPAADRFGLATAFNNLLAAPGFDTWMEGEPLSVDRLLYTPEGRPRLSVISIAHLGDCERMFFVSLLFNELLGWMRAQAGTTSLRALLYMDEVFGYFPPVADPPSKTPLLTLLKQGRAFGVGVLLATQNPVDLDYKGLSNAGTWFLGRLQTERDKARVLEGLEGVVTGSGGRFDRSYYDKALSGLSARIFLMNNVHDVAPLVFETRWAMSYLRGPLTRDQIRTLMAPRRLEARVDAPDPAVVSRAPEPPRVATTTAPVAAAAAATGGVQPVLPPGIQQFFLPVSGQRAAGAPPSYVPRAIGFANVGFSDAKLKVSHTTSLTLLAPIDPRLGTVAWSDAVAVNLTPDQLEARPVGGTTFAPLPPMAAKAKAYAEWEKDLKRWLGQSQQLELVQSSQTGLTSMPGESERDFRIRLRTLAREQRDAGVLKLRQKYAPRIAAIDERIRRAEQAVARESEQASQQKLQTALSVGATVLGALLGRKTISTSTLGRATTAARGMGRTMKERQDIERAKETVETVQQQRADLEAQVQAEIDALASALDPLAEPLVPRVLRPKRGDVSVRLVGLAWVPEG
ncbi:MAG: ATP-binding protein [Acidobacteriota bacterium]